MKKDKNKPIVVDEIVEQNVGHDRDSKGCIGSAGYTWSKILQECIRTFDLPLMMFHPDDSAQTYACFFLFSEDALQLEVFMKDAPESLLMLRSGNSWFDQKGQYIFTEFSNRNYEVREATGKLLYATE